MKRIGHMIQKQNFLFTEEEVLMNIQMLEVLIRKENTKVEV